MVISNWLTSVLLKSSKTELTLFVVLQSILLQRSYYKKDTVSQLTGGVLEFLSMRWLLELTLFQMTSPWQFIRTFLKAKLGFLPISIKMRKVLWSIFWLQSWPKDTETSKKEPKTLLTTDGSRVSTGNNWRPWKSLLHFCPTFKAKETHRTSQTTQSHKSQPKLFIKRMMSFWIGNKFIPYNFHLLWR